jgi:hypothetical protein
VVVQQYFDLVGWSNLIRFLSQTWEVEVICEEGSEQPIHFHESKVVETVQAAQIIGIDDKAVFSFTSSRLYGYI